MSEKRDSIYIQYIYSSKTLKGVGAKVVEHIQKDSLYLESNQIDENDNGQSACV